MYNYHETSENEEVRIEIFDTAGITVSAYSFTISGSSSGKMFAVTNSTK